VNFIFLLYHVWRFVFVVIDLQFMDNFIATIQLKNCLIHGIIISS